ncbi:3-keto-disaccharide hydrolase [Fulvivirga sedimenti]|uniref:DUF1080 domain-containing protein n=1 Tax=Fulvivirga sedimenti TaxID=2879465 RepID=A0A9X1HVR7_9BACT|nr:DUF1080 domain-containing protein [Fulvivirga sedimenti]MCA6079164.1 DUF1080 domain-containing protein [Fulvivirga sedimenti]
MKNLTNAVSGLIAMTMFWSCGKSADSTESSEMSEEPVTEEVVMTAPNTLTEEEQNAGWKLLFDGATTNGWRNFKSDSIGAAWQVQDGTLYLDTSEKDGWQVKHGGDIITDEIYENYELSLQWKIDTGANSGIIYHVQEGDEYNYVWQTGPEMQILDDDRHPDGKIDKHRVGDLYDLIEGTNKVINPPGEWNTVRIVSNQGKIEHWLNGVKIVSADMNSPEWTALVAGSKFAQMPGFGKYTKGHIALQDHGNPVWFRNIKIRVL